MRNILRTLAAALVCLCLAAPAMAAGYPGKTINILNAFLPGGWLDLSCRTLLEPMAKELGVTVITTPTPGAGGSIGYTKAAQSKADGYTALVSVSSTLLCSGALRDVRYTIDDFIPIGAYCAAANAIVIRDGETRFTDFASLVAYAKEHPGELSVGMSGVKNTSGAAWAMFENMMGVKFKVVPFNGAVAANSAVVAGHVDVAITQQLATSGIKPLMTFGCKFTAYPDMPTAKELGLKYQWTDYTGIFVPKGTPADVVARLEQAVLKAASDPATVEALRNLKVEPMVLNAKEFAAAIQENKDILAELLEKGVLTTERKAK